MRVKRLAKQFIRYAAVGAIAFIADFSVLSVIYKVLLRNFRYGLFVGTAAGFIVGTVVNYCVSKRVVFSKDTSRTKNVIIEFLIYAVIGLFGLLLTEAGMYLGVEVLLFNYIATKILVAGLVLIWNFLARRFLVFK